ncbi:MAG: hypothetical protein ABIW82_11750 [Dokdonella sp.]
MNETTVPEFFRQFPIQPVSVADLDTKLARGAKPLSILFLWGHDCPNCDVAKRAILGSSARFLWPEVSWLHGNVYAQPALGTHFGLHGIPAFMIFHWTRKLGRITPWPGPDAFVTAIETQIAMLGAEERP